MENLFNCNGLDFRAKINGKEVMGKIHVSDGIVVLAAYTSHNSPYPHDDFQYWSFTTCDKATLEKSNIVDLEVIYKTDEEIESYKDFKVGDIVCNGAQQMKVIYRSGDLVVLQLESGRASKNYTVTELYDDGWRLKSPRPEGKQEEKEKYQPKAGDLVYAEVKGDIKNRFIFIYGDNTGCAIDYLRKRWELTFGIRWMYDTIRPATPKEAVLFTRILSKNGYEYDPEKKEVRKK